MTDNPEVRGYEVTCDLVGSEDQHVFGMNTKAFAELTATGDGAAFFELIRLTDHEAARAADKARIAELEAALSIDLPKLLDRLDEALEDIELHGRHSDRGYHQLSGWYKNARRITSAIDAALAQQGKDGGE
tara:strand:- start:729 stop:1121 length:393 start_codon:yes stop_codon:yes gene_type:complete